MFAIAMQLSLMRLLKYGATALATLLMGCGDRDGSIKAALDLAEALYPGQLEFHDTQLQKGYYDIILAVRHDPVTRIRLQMDRNPADCRPGTRCEERLREAYTVGIAVGSRLKALDRTFRQCGIPLLAVEMRQPDSQDQIIELPLGEQDQQPQLDRLASCVARFSAVATPDMMPGSHLRFRILRQHPSGPATAPHPLTFEDRLPSDRQQEPSYLVSTPLEAASIPASSLRLHPRHLLESGLDKKLARIALDWLNEHHRGAGMPPFPSLRETMADPRRLDVIRTYVMACSSYKSGTGPCDYDIAVRMTYDMKSGEASDLSLVPVTRTADGRSLLPPLPGR